jgi:hypothetical protein
VGEEDEADICHLRMPFAGGFGDDCLLL